MDSSLLDTPKAATTTNTSSSTTSSSPNSSPSNSHESCVPLVQTPLLVVSPCAACKILRRRCVEKCVLAPYFPPTEPLKFTTAHRVFGASNIIKFLQDLPEVHRADAVSSMVYEANARIRDPVYGSAGVICQLQKQVSDLQAQLALAQADLLNMHTQQTNLMAVIFMEMAQHSNSNSNANSHHDHHQLFFDDHLDGSTPDSHNSSIQSNNNGGLFFEDINNNNNVGSAWEPLWT